MICEPPWQVTVLQQLYSCRCLRYDRQDDLAQASSTGQQHRPAAQASSTGQQHRPAAQASSTGQQHRPAAQASSTDESRSHAAHLQDL